MSEMAKKGEYVRFKIYEREIEFSFMIYADLKIFSARR